MSNVIEQKLSRIEAHLKKLIEGSAALVFPTLLNPDEISQNLVRAMEDNIKQDQDGKWYAPDQFRIKTSPETAKILLDHPNYLNKLISYLEDMGVKEDIGFYNTPSFIIQESGEFHKNQLEINAEFGNNPLPHTSLINLTDNFDRESNLPGGFLIVDGLDIFPLNQRLINIGRKNDNQLAIDDPRVSRQHAQLRFIKGSFYLFDLGSSGGTFVNGNRVKQSQLHPGDVISLAGFPIVFGIDTLQTDETSNFTHRIQINEDEENLNMEKGK